MLQNVTLLAYSLNPHTGDRAATFLFRAFPYSLLQELATHRKVYGSVQDEPPARELRSFPRDLGMSVASLRAIPCDRVVESVLKDPYLPPWTGANKGMVGKADVFGEEEIARLNTISLSHLYATVEVVTRLKEIGVAKQDANRFLSPWLKVPVLVSGTTRGWANFFDLRCAEDVQPAFRAIALKARELWKITPPQKLSDGEWHIPWLEECDRNLPLNQQLERSVSRSAWVSFAAHDKISTPEKFTNCFNKLKAERHWTPFEHQMQCTGQRKLNTRNLDGFYSLRHQIEDGIYG